MQTISTKYLPITATRPQRIKATHCGGATSVTWSIDEATPDGDDERYAFVAKMLRDKLNWRGRMVGGHTRHGMVFVFVDGAVVIEGAV